MTIAPIERVYLDGLDYVIIYMMMIISLVPVAAISRTRSTPERILYATSFGTKLALMIMTFGVLRGDWMIGCIGAFILVVGDAGMLILSLIELDI